MFIISLNINHNFFQLNFNFKLYFTTTDKQVQQIISISLVMNLSIITEMNPRATLISVQINWVSIDYTS